MILIPENESDVKSSVWREVELEADRSFSEQEQQLPEHAGYKTKPSNNKWSTKGKYSPKALPKSQ